MAKVLYRLGRFAARRRFLVIGVWLVLLVGVLAGVLASGAKTDDEFRIPGTESQQALDVLSRTFPATAGTFAQIVFQAPDGASVTSAAARAEIGRIEAAAAGAPQVVALVDPFTASTVTPDHRVAMAQVRYAVRRGQLVGDATSQLTKRVATASAGGTLRVVVGGDAFGATGVRVSPKELTGVVVALVVLLVTFGSILAAGMTILAALLGVGVGLAGLLSLTKVITLSSTAPTLALMIGLAVGIDYSLFILSRHRTQLAEGMSVDESIGRAVGTSGSAVVFAGLTVVIAMAGLSVVRIPFLTVMGLAAALTVALAVGIAITLLPAMLGLAGERLRPRPGSHFARLAAEEVDESRAMPLGERWARLVIAKPLVTIAVVVIGLLVVALPARDLRLALPDNGSAKAGTSQRVAYDLISRSFGPGFNGPLVLLVQPASGSGGTASGATAATGLRGQALLAAAATVRAEVASMPNVVAASAPQLNPAGSVAIVQVVPSTGPADSATKQLVKAIRAKERTLDAQTSTSVRVTGTTAANIDVSDRLGSALLPFACVVVGLALILLLLVFRSIAVPVKAALGFLLSIAVGFGVVDVVFGWGWFDGLLGVQATGPVISFLPIVVIAVLFGLAMDYEVFLVSRIRESYVHGATPREAIRIGFRHASRVVTAAALIMFCVFASFISANDQIVKPMAVALAAGVLVDAFLVRMTLVPAVLALLDRHAWWWPRVLERVVPRVDIEGKALSSIDADAPERVSQPV